MRYGYPAYGMGMGMGMGMNPYAMSGMYGNYGIGRYMGVGGAASMMAYPQSYLGMGGMIADPMTSAYLARGGSTMMGGYGMSPYAGYGMGLY